MRIRRGSRDNAGMRVAWLAAVGWYLTVSLAAAQPATGNALRDRILAAAQGAFYGWELAADGGQQDDDVFVQWRRGRLLLDVACARYLSPDQAVAALRELRRFISPGVPVPLPGVADEAYSIGPHGLSSTWTFYFARRTYTCRIGSAPEPDARRLMEIVISSIDAS